MGTETDGRTHQDDVARWLIHHESGGTTEQPVVYGRDILDWKASPSTPTRDGTPRIAWAGTMPSPHRGQSIHLYLMTWENPRPELGVESLDFEPGSLTFRPFVLGITTE